MPELGVLSPLITLLADEEEDCRRYAAMTLVNLATDAENQVRIVRLGGLPPIIKLASDQHSEASRYAGMVLANLATNRINRQPVVTLGALAPLTKMAFAQNAETQRAAALALYNVSCLAANHVPMIRADVVSALTNLGHGDDLECRRYSIMTLSNLAANSETRPAATRSGGLQTAVAMVKDDDLECRRYACIAVCNMANTAITQEQLVVHGALPMVLQMANGTNDVDTQRQALLALVNLAASERNHPTLFAKGIMRIVNTAFSSMDIDCREYGAFIVANMCSNPDYLANIGANGGIPPLMMLTKSENINTLCIAIAALRRLAKSEENWNALIEAGVLDSLASAGFSTELEVQKEVAACICSLSLSAAHRVEIAYKCIRAIVQLSSVANLEVARQAVGSMANLAEEVDTHEYIARANGGKCLTALEHHKSLDIQREATRGIANLLSSLRHQSIVIQDGIPGLLQLAYSDDEQCCYHLALSLRKLSPNLKSHPVFVFNGGFKAVFRLLTLPNLNTQKQAAAALRDFCANADFKLKCAEDGGIAALISLCRHTEEQLQALALASLRHLSLHDALKQRIVEERALRPAIRCAQFHNEDIHIQVAGLLANLSENADNQIPMIEDSVGITLVSLAHGTLNKEVQQDISRCLANLLSNEETHHVLYQQGALLALVKLTETDLDITQRYAAMGLRFLAADPEIRVFIVRDGHVAPFVILAASPVLEYRRTAATCFASFTLHESNKSAMVRVGVIKALLALAIDEDLPTKRDALFSVANLAESLELQGDLIREGVLKVLCEVASHNDARVQRDTARGFSTLTQTDVIRAEMMGHNALHPVLTLAKSLDVACQRFATLTLCNMSCGIGEHKVRLIQDGILRPLIFLARFPDAEIQRYAALALAGLALGGHGNNKTRIVDEGAMKPIVDLVKFPDRHVQLAAVLAINSIVIGEEMATKSAVMTEQGLEPVLQLIDRRVEESPRRESITRKGKKSAALSETGKQRKDADTQRKEEIIAAAVYALGSLSEQEDVQAKLVELNAISAAVKEVYLGNVEIKRAAAYFLSTCSERTEFHQDMNDQGALEAVVSLAVMEDVECQEYAAFALAHLSSNRDLQSKLVEVGAVKALVAMVSADLEPKHYGGLALLKLADNFENHLKIAEEGGIQALLRLGRTRSTDQQLQYKAALTVGQLASNAVRVLPRNAKGATLENTFGSSAHEGSPMKDGGVSGDQSTMLAPYVSNAAHSMASGKMKGFATPSGTAGGDGKTIGHGARLMGRLRTESDTQKARQRTTDYIETTLKESTQQAQMESSSGGLQRLTDGRDLPPLRRNSAAEMKKMDSKSPGKMP
jgi:hypothetical protein